MSKMLFIIPPRVYGPDEYARVHPPLGVLYVGAVMEEDGHEVHLIDCVAEAVHNRMYFDGRREFAGLEWDELLRRAADIQPDYLMVANLYTNFAKGAERAIKLLKERFPETPLIVGGPHATLLNTDLMDQQPQIDYVVTSEAEYSTRSLIRLLEGDGGDLSKIPGLVWRDNGNLRRNPVQFIEDIDSLPIPARRLLNQESYSALSFMAPVLKSVEIMSSRGCPCSCGFCSTTRVWGRRYRPRSIENLLEEVDQLEAEGVNHIYFSDDCFNVDKERTRKFCEHMKKKKDMLWCCHQGMITTSIDEGLLEDMAESGMYYFALPVESGNQEVLNTLIQKPSNLDHTRKIARKAKELGLYTVGFFILGVPTETKAQIEDTLRFAEELDLDYSAFALFRPYPGTPLTELAKKKGLIVNPKQGVDEFSYYEARIRSDEYDEGYLESKRREIWNKISEPKLKTVMENKDVYYALLEPFVDRFPALFEGKRR